MAVATFWKCDILASWNCKHIANANKIEWLREIRRKITSDFDHDQKKIGDYLREREKLMGDRIVRSQDRLVPAKP